MFTDAAYYLSKVIKFEKTNETAHLKWTNALNKNLDALVKLYNDNGDFGHLVDLQNGTVIQNGTASGSRGIGALAIGYELTCKESFLAIAKVFADFYYNRHIKTVYTNGGPLDISKAVDAESNVALLESFLDLYKVTKEDIYLSYAKQSADIFATWVMSYNGIIPENTTMGKMNIQTTGGVLANVKNQHIGPSAFTSSMASLIDLYLFTKDTYYLELLKDVSSGIAQYVTRYEGHAGNLKPGMMTEQVNISDAYTAPGYFWEVSATWPKTGMMLTRMEVSSVFVDFSSKVTTAFDQLEVLTNYDNVNITIKNNTDYDSSTKVMNENREVIIVDILAKQSKKFTFNYIN